MEEMTTTLLDAGERELLALAFMFGNAIDGGRAFNEWITRRLAMLDDILEESPLYQELLRRGAEEERRRRIQDQRDTVVSFVQMRFSELVPLAEQQLVSIHDADELHDLVLKLFAAQNAEEARQLLMGTDED